MSGVEELRARLAKLSIEIDMQKEVVRKLEFDKNLVQRQLNAVLDPVARLPLEISSEIFLQCLPALSTLSEPGAEDFPMLLLNICHAWTAIALSAPTLWAAIHIVHLRAESTKKILPIWLHRAGNCPLSLSFGASIDHEVAAIIWGHGEQLKHLEICCDKKHYEDRNGNNNIDGDPIILFGASPVLRPLPLLETLTIRGSTTGHSHSIFQILELLRAAPNLVECVFDRTYPAYRIEHIAGTLVLPTLRRLTFGKTERHNKLLPYLSLPMLEVLSFPLYHFDDVISLLERSSPPLRELVALIDGVEFTRVAECLHLVPTLMRLEVRWPATHLATELYAALADSPSLLPNLIGLTVRLHAYETSALSWKTLLRALSARRTQLRVVHVKLKQESSPPSYPTADIIASFRELAADGMELYIGLKDVILYPAEPS